MDEDLENQLKHLDEVNDIIKKLKDSENFDQIEREKIVLKGKIYKKKQLQIIKNEEIYEINLPIVKKTFLNSHAVFNRVRMSVHNLTT